MTRHVGAVTDREWALLHTRVGAWLVEVDVLGAVTDDYSLAQALDDERARAQQSWRVLQAWLRKPRA